MTDQDEKYEEFGESRFYVSEGLYSIEDLQELLQNCIKANEQYVEATKRSMGLK